MKTMKGLDFWTRSGVWWELIIPGYFFGKTFGTSDAKYRVIDTFMYPEAFIRLSGFFRDLAGQEYYYTGRFLGMLAGAAIGVLYALFIGLLYKWVLKDWAYAKAARIGSLAFILIALLTGFMSDFFCENIGMELRIEQKAPDELWASASCRITAVLRRARRLPSRTLILLSYYGEVRANNPAGARGWWIGSIVFMYTWFVLYFVCARPSCSDAMSVPREKWFKLQIVNFVVLLIYLRMGFGMSAEEFHFVLTRAPYILGGN